jgi:hypothetical protein
MFLPNFVKFGQIQNTRKSAFFYFDEVDWGKTGMVSESFAADGKTF